MELDLARLIGFYIQVASTERAGRMARTLVAEEGANVVVRVTMVRSILTGFGIRRLGIHDSGRAIYAASSASLRIILRGRRLRRRLEHPIRLPSYYRPIQAPKITFRKFGVSLEARGYAELGRPGGIRVWESKAVSIGGGTLLLSGRTNS